MAQGQTFLSFFSSRRIGCFTVRLASPTCAVGAGAAKFVSSLNRSFFTYCNVCPVDHVPAQCDERTVDNIVYVSIRLPQKSGHKVALHCLVHEAGFQIFLFSTNHTDHVV
ncbi:unnamed protein product [Ectocarpus sp. 8 AP-2014]